MTQRHDNLITSTRPQHHTMTAHHDITPQHHNSWFSLMDIQQTEWMMLLH